MRKFNVNTHSMYCYVFSMIELAFCCLTKYLFMTILNETIHTYDYVLIKTYREPEI